MAYDRDRYDRDPRDERGTFQRAGDEVRSWFGDDDAQRRRERDDRERMRGYRSEEGFRDEGYREYGDRYGRSYSSPIDRDRFPADERPLRPSSQPFLRGSREFGTEGYGSPTAYGGSRATGREWWSPPLWRAPGPHAGRGPRGYQRSDERIREEVNDRLTAHGLIDATEIQVQVQNGEITLTGFVDGRAAKRAAEDCADDIAGVREVNNHLRIRSQADDTGVGRTSVLGLTERETQNAATARQGEAASRSRPRNT